MARPKLSPRQALKVYIPLSIFSELLLVDTSLQDSTGTLKYGAVSSLITRLVQEHVERKKTQIRMQVLPRQE